MSNRIQITPAGREVVEARRERDEAQAEVERLRARQNAVIHRIHTGDAGEGWGSRAVMEIYEELTDSPYPT